jgi:WD40 repeat protein
VVKFRHQNQVYSIQFTRDGRRFLTASADQTARLWDAATGQPVGKPLAHGALVQVARFSPDEATILTGCADGTVRLWDAATQEPLRPPLQLDGGFRDAAVSPDGQRFATVTPGGAFQIWATDTHQPVGPAMALPLPGVQVLFTPDSRHVVYLGRSAGQCFSAATGAPVGRRLELPRPLLRAVLTDGGATLLAIHSDHEVVRWRVPDGEPLQPLVPYKAPSEHVPGPVVFSADHRLVVTAFSKKVQALDARDGKTVGPLKTVPARVAAVALSPDRTTTAASAGKHVYLWDTATGKPLGPALEFGFLANEVALSPDGRTLVAIDERGNGRIVRVPYLEESSTERLRLWVEVRTGLELDAFGAVQPLSDADRTRRAERLRQLPGPPLP